MIVEHGGNGRLLAEKNGNSSEKWIDFSANINPLGVSTSLRQVLVDSIDRITEYPDITNQYAKDLLREHHGNHFVKWCSWVILRTSSNLKAEEIIDFKSHLHGI